MLSLLLTWRILYHTEWKTKIKIVSLRSYSTTRNSYTNCLQPNVGWLNFYNIFRLSCQKKVMLYLSQSSKTHFPPVFFLQYMLQRTNVNFFPNSKSFKLFYCVLMYSNYFIAYVVKQWLAYHVPYWQTSCSVFYIKTANQ